MFNIFVVLTFTFIVALALVYLIAAHDKKLRKRLKARRKEEDKQPPPAMDFRQFTKACLDICEHLKLEIEDVTQSGNDEMIVRATSADPITQVTYLVVGFHLHKDDTLANTKIVEISEQIISERLSKGIIVTTGRIDPTIKGLPELAPMEFIDGAKLNALIDQYKITV